MEDRIIGRLTSGYYTSHNSTYPTLNLSIRIDNDHKKIVQIGSPIRPYFVCTGEMLEKSRKRAEKLEEELLVELVNWNHATKDGNLYRVSMWNPKHVGVVNKGLDRRLDEADIPYIRRVLTDLGVKTKIMIDGGKIGEYDGDVPYPRILYIDCECDERWKIKNNIDFRKARILVIGTVDDEGKVMKFNLKSEKQTLLNFAAYASRYDLLIYYDPHPKNNFDEDIIRERTKQTNMGFDWRKIRFVNIGRLHKKMMSRIERGAEGEEERGEQFSWSLEYIIEQEGLDVKKIKIPQNKFYECWLNNPKLLEKRCINDALALKLLEDKHQHIKHHIKVADLCGIFVDEATYEMPVVDALILRDSNRETPRLVWGSRQYEEKRERYKAAIVYEPKPGVHRNVLDLDIVSQYNRVIQTFQISPEVYRFYMMEVDEFDLEGFLHYCIEYAKKNGSPLFPRLLNRLENERNEYKALRNKNASNREVYIFYDAYQYAYKVTLLIFYGILGNSSARMHIRDVARAIPYMARKISLTSKARLEKYYVPEITYGDTDSMMSEFPNIGQPERLVSIGHAITSDLNAFYYDWLGDEYDIPKNDRRIEIEFNKVYRRLLFIEAKKKYGYHKIWDANKGFCDETGVVGFESIKANYCQFARRLQREIIEMVVRDREKEALIYFRDAKKRLFNGDYNPFELVISEGLRKDIDDYKVNDMHVRAAKKFLNLTGGLPDDGRIRFVITHGGSRPKVYPVIEDEIKEINETGLKYYWTNQVAPASLRVLKAAGFTDGEIGGRKELEAFFT